jgi:hypothetical protein
MSVKFIKDYFIDCFEIPVDRGDLGLNGKGDFFQEFIHLILEKARLEWFHGLRAHRGGGVCHTNGRSRRGYWPDGGLR